MSANLIRDHFARFLGADVRVSFLDSEEPFQVFLYRPDKLSEAFVIRAFEALETAEPKVAYRIARLLVSYDGRFGRAQYSVRVPFAVPALRKANRHASPINDNPRLTA
jgi:hypothetical protein